jgi:hypothetical protein
MIRKIDPIVPEMPGSAPSRPDLDYLEYLYTYRVYIILGRVNISE